MDQLILGWVLIVLGVIFIILAAGALLKKARAAGPSTLGFWEAITEAIKAGGPAAIVMIVGVGMVITGLTMIGVELPWDQ